LHVCIRIAFTRYFLKHSIDCANVKVNALVQAGAKAVDECDGANVQICLVWVLSTRAVGLSH
jgi:hypothetical protein